MSNLETLFTLYKGHIYTWEVFDKITDQAIFLFKHKQMVGMVKPFNTSVQ